MQKSPGKAPKSFLRRNRRKGGFGALQEQEVNTVLFSTSEIDVLRLLRWCRYLPRKELTSVFPEETIQTLSFFRFISLYQKHDAYVLTRAGDRFLDEHFENLPPLVRPSYREDDFIRRARAARFALTAYWAGLTVFHTELSSLDHNAACYLTAQARTKGANPWGSTRVFAILRLGNTVCGVYYVGPGIGKLSVFDEMNAFMNHTGSLKGVSRALIFTGESSEAIYECLGAADRDSEAKLVSYGDAFHRLDLPIYLIPHDQVGAWQLHIMTRTDYREQMAKLALSDYFEMPPAEHPEWDAMYKGTPLIMAADMDVKRLDAAVKSAAKDKSGPAVLVALKGQEKVLSRRYKRRGLARSVNTFRSDKEEVLRALALSSPSDRQFETAKGEVIHAAFNQRKGKAENKAGQSVGKLDLPE